MIIGSAASFEVLYVGLIDFGSGACAACIFFFAYSMKNVLTGQFSFVVLSLNTFEVDKTKYQFYEIFIFIENFCLGDPRHAESVEKTRRYGPTTDNPTQLVRILYDDEKVNNQLLS